MTNVSTSLSMSSKHWSLQTHVALQTRVLAAAVQCVQAYFRDAVLVRHHPDNVIQRQQRVALDLRVDVLALRAHSQQLHQVNVVYQGAVHIHPVPFRAHHLDQSLEGGSVVVKDQDVLSCIHKLEHKRVGLQNWSEKR